jgi:hypothetical protein
VPAVAALATLTVTWRLYPNPQDLEIEDARITTSSNFPRAYWVYLCSSALVAAGYADYPLLAYHFGHASTVNPARIPALYALAMGIDAISALVVGRWFDRFGPSVLVVTTVLSAAFAPLGFGTRGEFAVHDSLGNRDGRSGVRHARGSREYDGQNATGGCSTLYTGVPSEFWLCSIRIPRSWSHGPSAVSN